MSTKAQEYAARIAGAVEQVTEATKAERARLCSLEQVRKERPRLLLNQAVKDPFREYSHDPADQCAVVFAEVGDDGSLSLLSKYAMKPAAVVEKLIPWLIEHYGAPPVVEKKKRRFKA